MKSKIFRWGTIKREIPQKTIILGHDNDKPIIKAFAVGPLAVFWCEYCKTFHTHGNEDGHRVAHCVSKDSPFKKTGYILKVEP